MHARIAGMDTLIASLRDLPHIEDIHLEADAPLSDGKRCDAPVRDRHAQAVLCWAIRVHIFPGQGEGG